MIVGYIADRVLRAALLAAAHPEEDVILAGPLADEAVACGFPRLVITTPKERGRALAAAGGDALPILCLTPASVERWEAERLGQDVPPTRVTWAARELSALMEREGHQANWVDRALADLGRAAGAPLPAGLRGFARRVMEFPSHYDDLHPLAKACGMTRGALKARFRRRGLSSPYAYLRWFRMLAVAYALSDRDVTVAQVADRLGFTSDGNLCRTMGSLTGLTPTEARTVHGWNRLLVTLAWRHLGAGDLARWDELDLLFTARGAA